CCGALLGVDGEVVEAVRVPNEAERPGARYRVSAARVRTLEADARSRGLEVVGFYHSHPRAAALPSPLDLEMAWPWYVYVIKGVDGLGAYRLREDRSAFSELRILPTPGEDRLAS
ncbi:MAG TPA: M67 family metallopeptidase, partial [Longimicrobiales bacterium]|nr:M67 family metallopeptidase [Longimicrobiales bacterium]